MAKCDLLIRNASVFDGTGRDAESLDIAVQDGQIREVDRALPLSAATEIDADGLALAPGFIDTHTHDDTSVIETPADVREKVKLAIEPQNASVAPRAKPAQ